MAVVDERRDGELEALYRRYADDVQRYARALLPSAADAEDVTQQTFVNAYRALLRGDRPRKPLHWLIAIAHNVHRERLRQSSRRPTEVELDETAPAAAREDDGWSAEEIRRALDRLGSKQRDVIVLRELEGRSYAEIAELLGLSKPATEALAFRARRALREQLEGGLSCDDARAAVRRRLDGGLPGPEQGALRAHLRECRACAGKARSERGRRRRRPLGGLAALPLPLHPLEALFGGGASSAGSGVAAKVAVAAAAGVVATGVGYDGLRHATNASRAPTAKAAPATPPARRAPIASNTVLQASDRPIPKRQAATPAKRHAALVPKPTPKPKPSRPGAAAASPTVHRVAPEHDEEAQPSSEDTAGEKPEHPETDSPAPANPSHEEQGNGGDEHGAAKHDHTPPNDHASTRGDDPAPAAERPGHAEGRAKGRADDEQAAAPEDSSAADEAE